MDGRYVAAATERYRFRFINHKKNFYWQSTIIIFILHRRSNSSLMKLIPSKQTGQVLGRTVNFSRILFSE